MKPDELRYHLTKFTYKGKYNLSLEQGKMSLLGYPSEDYHLILRLWCEDSERKSGPNWINMSRHLFIEDIWKMNFEQLQIVVLNLFLDLERHEVMEWLRYNDQHVRDPHPENNRGKGRKPRHTRDARKDPKSKRARTKGARSKD